MAASLVFQINLATSAGETKTKNADHSSIGQFFWSWAFLSLASLQCSHNAVVNFYNFWNQILLKVFAYIL